VRILSALLALTLLFPAVCSPSYSRLLASVRPLELEVFSELEPDVSLTRIICTTTSINSRMGLWLTANHCTGHGPTFITGAAVVVLVADKQNDLAILHTPSLQGIPALKLAVEPPSIGMPVQMLGHPMGFTEPQYFAGFVSHLDTHVFASGQDYGHKMMFQMVVCGGNSGSAVVNARDEIISVMQIGPGNPCAPLSGGATWEAMQALAKYFGA